MFCDDLLRAVCRFDDFVLWWHGTEPVAASTDGGIEMKALRLHAMNFNLWHHEDAVRRPGAADSEVAHRKRCIDDLNASRNAAIEDIDVAMLDRFDPHRDGYPILHTETPGMIVDRISVLTLRISHTCQESQATRARRAILHEQYDDLVFGLEQFLKRMQDGEIGFRIYRQFKSADQRGYCALFEHGFNHQESDPI